jgi:2-hydroxycyclohexanecarboxyl-CoA dehydrogenase
VGIGRATAERLAGEGALVCVNDLDRTMVLDVAEAIGGYAAPFDVGDPEAVRDGLAECERALGPIDLLVGNHVHATMGSFVGEAATELARRREANLHGTAWLIRACAPAMAARGYGRIVAISSEPGLGGWPEVAECAGGEDGIIGLVRSLAREYAPSGVAINAVAPGGADSHRLDLDAGAAGLTHEEILARWAGETPLGGVGLAADVAATVAFLLSRPAIALVGQVVGPSGGSTRV